MNDTRSGRTPSQRQLRLGEVIRHAFSEIFLRTDIRDADLAGVVLTVSEVRLSPDARNATIFVAPLGGENQDIVADALQRHSRFLRGELARKVEMKYVPDITFKPDTSFDTSDRIDELLRSRAVARDLDPE